MNMYYFGKHSIFILHFQPFKRLQRIQHIIQTTKCEVQGLKISSEEDQRPSESRDEPTDKRFSIESCDLEETTL
jgi:hypothetical protein